MGFTLSKMSDSTLIIEFDTYICSRIAGDVISLIHLEDQPVAVHCDFQNTVRIEREALDILFRAPFIANRAPSYIYYNMSDQLKAILHILSMAAFSSYRIGNPKNAVTSEVVSNLPNSICWRSQVRHQVMAMATSWSERFLRVLRGCILWSVSRCTVPIFMKYGSRD